MGRSVAWIPADGRPAITLSDRPAGYRMLAGATGLDAPEYDVTVGAVPGLDGAQLRSVRPAPRLIRWPMLISGRTRDEYRARARRLLNAFDPAKGPGTLQVQEADGTTRLLRCIYTGGLEGDGALTASGDGRWLRAVVQFLAPNPWWAAATPITRSFPYSGGPAALFFPILPLELSVAAVLGDTTVDNPGDVDAWPIWQITPPALGVTLRRTDTDETIDLAGAIPAGDALLIVTEPGQQSIRLLSGENRWPNLLEGSTLWKIPGEATGVPVELLVDGAAAGTLITLTYYPQYRSAL